MISFHDHFKYVVYQGCRHEQLIRVWSAKYWCTEYRALWEPSGENTYFICFLALKEGESRSVVSDSLWPHGLYGPWNSPGQNTGVGSLSPLQGIFPTQQSNPGLLHCRWILYQLSHKGQAKNYSEQKWHFSPRVRRAVRHVTSWPLWRESCDFMNIPVQYERL